MSTSALQAQLISKIQNTTDVDILEGVLRLLEFETAHQEIYPFNDEEKNAISKAREQVANGRYLTDEEVDKLTEEWLKR